MSGDYRARFEPTPTNGAYASRREMERLRVLIRTESGLAASRSAREQAAGRGVWERYFKPACEGLSLIGLVCTLFLVNEQVVEMRRAYGPLDIQAKAALQQAEVGKAAFEEVLRQARESEVASREALAQARVQLELSAKAVEAATRQAVYAEAMLDRANRAWVGARTAVLGSHPAPGIDLDLRIPYANGGRETATEMQHSSRITKATRADFQSGAVDPALKEFQHACMSKSEWSGGAVVLPVTTSSYDPTFFIKADGRLLDQSWSHGDQLILVQGCFVYRTSGRPRHHAYCFFYDPAYHAKQPAPVALSMCPAAGIASD